MSRWFRIVLGFSSVLVLKAAALAQTEGDPAPSERELELAPAPRDKSGYHLFNPTPRELWRPISADRPDLTESPYTVDAGAFQVELSFFEYAFDDSSSGTDQEWAVAPTNFKIGLTNNTDIQFLWAPYLYTDSDEGGSEGGVGNFALRLKTNLYGNDREDGFAIGFLPFIEFPTGDDDVAREDVSGGFAVPVSLELGGGWGLGTQIQFEWAEDDDGDDTEAFFSHTLVLSHQIAGDLSGYVEYFAEVGIDNGDDYSPILAGGLTYELNSNTMFDVGLLIGLDEGDTPDLAIFSGLTLRF